MLSLHRQLLPHRLLVRTGSIQGQLQRIQLRHIILRIRQAVVLQRVGAVIILQGQLQPAHAGG